MRRFFPTLPGRAGRWNAVGYAPLRLPRLILLAAFLAQPALAGGKPAQPTAAEAIGRDAINGVLAAEAAPAQKRPRDIGLRSSAGSEILALAAHASASDGLTYLTVDLSAALNVSAFVLASPDRIIVEMPETSFHIADEAGRLARPVGLIKAFRFGQFAQGKSRMVIDLAGPAKIVKAASARLAAGDPARLVIALAPEAPDEFAAAAARSAVVEAEALRRARPPAAKAVSSAKPVIVIDAGHGGIDTGATGQAGSASISEKAIVYAFARALTQKLAATRRYIVIETRESDVFVSLDERVRIARDNHAALFISVHADTLSESADVSGATVYTGAERASDTESARIAEKENAADQVAGVTATEETSEVSDILFDLTRRETRAYSHVFARQLTGAWANAARLNKNPERAAGFRVLRAPDVPSVLLELGYLSNDRDARSLVSPEWRDKATASVARAVDQFFAPRLVSDEPDGKEVDPVATGSINPSVPHAPQPASE